MNPLFFICLALLFSCSLKKEKQQKVTAISEITARKKIEIQFAGEIQSRRSLNDFQSLKSEREFEDYFAKQEKSNPVLHAGDSILKKKFEELGIVKGRELLLHKFKCDTLTRFQIADSIGKKINIQFDFVPGRLGGHKIIASFSQDSTEITIPGIMQDLKYILLDVIPGGNKEIVVLNEWYISNGYNFDLLVYKIKS